MSTSAQDTDVVKLPSFFPMLSVNKRNQQECQLLLDIIEVRLRELFKHLKVNNAAKSRFKGNWKIEWGNNQNVLLRIIRADPQHKLKVSSMTLHLLRRREEIDLFDAELAKYAKSLEKAPELPQGQDIGVQWWKTDVVLNDSIPPAIKMRSSSSAQPSTPGAGDPAQTAHAAKVAPATVKPAPKATPAQPAPSPTPAPPAPKATPSQSAPKPSGTPTAANPPPPDSEVAPTRASTPPAPSSETDAPAPPSTVAPTPSGPPTAEGATAQPSAKAKGKQAVKPTPSTPAHAAKATEGASTQQRAVLEHRKGIDAFDNYRVPHRLYHPTEFAKVDVSIPGSEEESLDVLMKKVVESLGNIYKALVEREVLLNNALVDIDNGVGALRRDFNEFRTNTEKALEEIKQELEENFDKGEQSGAEG